MPPTVLDDRDLRQSRCAAPTVDRQAQCSPNPRVVERLLFVVWRHRAADVPIALLHRDLVAEGIYQLVARRRRHAAELDCRAIAADCGDPHRLLVGEDAGEAVEIGQTLNVIIRVPHPLDRLSGLVGDEFERARTHDVRLVPARVLVEDRLLVNEVERVGERRQKRAGREFQTEDDGRRIGRLDLVDHQIVAGARAQHALRRKRDFVKARGDVVGGQRRAVGEFNAVADLKGVGLAVVGRLRHRRAQIADDIRRRGWIVRVDTNQDAVKGCDCMHRRISALAVPVKARRRVGRDHIGQNAAAFRRFLIRRRCRRDRRHAEDCSQRRCLNATRISSRRPRESDGPGASCEPRNPGFPLAWE